MSCMLPAGILATTYSPNNVLALGVAVWSFAQILSPSAAHVGLTTLVRCVCVCVCVFMCVCDHVSVGGWVGVAPPCDHCMLV